MLVTESSVGTLFSFFPPFPFSKFWFLLWASSLSFNAFMALLFLSFLLQSEQENFFTNWLALDVMFVVSFFYGCKNKCGRYHLGSGVEG